MPHEKRLNDVATSGSHCAHDVYRMKRLLIITTLCVVSSNAFGGQLDPRFDGNWVGIENLSGYFVHFQLGGGQNPAHVPAIIAIGDSGQTMGFVRGLTPGRYTVSSKSQGTTLVFKLGEMHPKGVRTYYGRTDGKLMLSADGNTLTETSYAIMPGWPHSANCVINGTFHRQGK